MHHYVRLGRRVRLAAFIALFAAAGALAFPVPDQNSTVTVSYFDGTQQVFFTGSRNFAGTSPSNATILDASSNIKVFQSANGFGRRIETSLQYPEVLSEGETLISHNFFKNDEYEDFFPGVPADGMVTIRVEGIHFPEPVVVDETTALFHMLWYTPQSRLLVPPYHPHNAHTLTTNFRDVQRFYDANVFEEMHHGPSHEVFGDLPGVLEIMGSGTNDLTLLATVPYSMFEHLADMDQTVPDGLPAPHGFLEPYHFHFEYVVSAVPEPATLLLLVGGALFIGRRTARTHRLTPTRWTTR